MGKKSRLKRERQEETDSQQRVGNEDATAGILVGYAAAESLVASCDNLAQLTVALSVLVPAVARRGWSPERMEVVKNVVLDGLRRSPAWTADESVQTDALAAARQARLGLEPMPSPHPETVRVVERWLQSGKGLPGLVARGESEGTSDG